MYLKRLELQGFKSFPEKLSLEFKNVIVAIVGPNGSGKSNIADAVRWVLGEQSVKSLRGQKWEDVIFTGTQNRRALNFAEVSITIDNSEKLINSDYTDVTVTRKVYRSGESGYLINGKSCRLKDVRELFMDTGVGKEGYSIVGQGKIDEILNAKSDERRQIFEEASGIVKFKSRRQEALGKLENERQNLVRLNDIITEIESNLEPLMEQSRIAKQYLDLAERQKIYEINIFIHEQERLKKEIKKLDEIYEANLETLKEKNDMQNEINSMIEMLKNESARLDEEIKELRDKVYENRSTQEKHENAIKIDESNILHFHDNVERLHEDINAANAKKERCENDLKLLELKKGRELMTLAANEKKLSDVQEEFESINTLLSASETEIEKQKNDIIENIRKASEIKSALSRLNSMKEQAEERSAKIDETKLKTGSILIQKETTIKALSEDYEHSRKQLAELIERKNNYAFEKENTQTQMNETKKGFEQLSKEIIKNKERSKVLSIMAREHEGFYKSVKEILKASSSGMMTGVRGAAGEAVSVSKEHEVAIEIALGSSMQCVITNNENDAKRAIEYLKRHNLGRATFLPITTAKPAVRLDKSIFDCEGIIGSAKSLVRYDKEFEPIMSNLLERVVVAENMRHAIEFSKKNNYSYRVVTLSGELISPQGAMTGGSLNEKRSSVFSRNREIAEIEANLNEFSSKKAALEAKIENFDNYLSDLKNGLETVYHEIDEARITINTLEQRLNTEKNDYAQINEQAEISNQEVMQIEKQLDELKSAIGEKNELLIKTEIEGREIEFAINEKQTLNQSEKEARDRKLAESANLRISVAEIGSSITAVNADIERLKKENEESRANIDSYSNEITRAEEKIKAAKKNIAASKTKIKELRALCENIEDDIVEKETDKLEHENDSIVAAKMQKELANDVSEINGQNIRIETRKERLNEDLQRAFNEMWENYEITLKEARKYEISEETVQSMQRTVKEIKSEIKSLGNVNVNAIEQYKETKERHEFLQGQRDDILTAEEKLKDIIDELTELMMTTFSEQFAVISKNFNDVFKEMFGGGNAYLELNDKENPLESGIEIIAELPGKKLQNISLLSGGEKALTAIALLFGILKLKPSPFCILDEIEAALDDANIVRFANYLKKLQNKTQFIVITHRKGSMEAANVLYGVTMEEQGVSKIISLNLEEAVS